MKGTKKRIMMRLAAYISLGTAAMLALASAAGMCEGSSATVVLAIIFEAISLACFWISGGF